MFDGNLIVFTNAGEAGVAEAMSIFAGAGAYQLAVKNGFVGTEQEYLASLKGGKGDQGEQGMPGEKGKDAYQSWLDVGNTGTEQDFIASQKGDKGDTGLQGLQGEAGLSAYSMWLYEGNEGTTHDFIASLKGLKGDKGDTGASGNDGLSTYQTWLGLGNDGTEQDFIASQKGGKGDQGEKGERGESLLTPGEQRIIPLLQSVPAGWIELSPTQPTIVSLNDYPNLAGLYSNVAPDVKLDIQALIESGAVVVSDSGHYGSRDGSRLFDGSLAQHAGDGTNAPGEYHTEANTGDEWVQLQFSESVKIVEVKYTQRDWPEGFIDNMSLQIPDGENWSTLKTSTLPTFATASRLVDYRDVAAAANACRFAFYHNGYASLGEIEIWAAGATYENSAVVEAAASGPRTKVIMWGG